MAIDWTKPVETAEDLPRPVQVLFDPRGAASAADMDGQLWRVTVDGDAIYRAHGDRITIRNVPPPDPEPVLREVWVSLYSHGGAAIGREENTHPAKGYEPVECRRIAWMSDGSPVPGEAPEAPEAPWKENSEYWRNRAEAAEQKRDTANRERIRWLLEGKMWRERAEKAEADLADMKTACFAKKTRLMEFSERCAEAVKTEGNHD